ncbi:hypothetical protein KC722_01300 [Candidatus Kaiserbacteria bacterium]|nr:hypothetical protein [Candidatus Kaiserbacteria bacterium]MCB9811984.1 hypothetical protein [Candidatus Nomurabacteria bacterium]
MTAWIVRTKCLMMMSEHRRSTLEDARQPRQYKISVCTRNNLLVLKSESPLLAQSRAETFDFPLRESSNHALSNTTDFGANLVKRIWEKVSGATNVRLLLYEATANLGGFYEPRKTLEQMEEILKSICNDAWLSPTITTETIPFLSHETTRAVPYTHPFGRLPLRLHEQRQRGRKRLVLVR